MATHEDVRRIALNLPGSIGGTDGAGFGIRRGGELKDFAWLWRERTNPKKARVPDPGVLAVSTPGFGAKEVLLASNPEIYLTEPHYNGHPAILVRLAAIGVEELDELLTDAWRTKAPKALVERFDQEL